MEINDYFDPKRQEEMRAWMRFLMVKECLTLVTISRMAGVTPLMLTNFILKGKKAGPKTIVGVAHVIDKYSEKYSKKGKVPCI